MAVYSMTGYASAQAGPESEGAPGDVQPGGNSRLGLEIRSVNSRFLDLYFRLPDELRQHESSLRDLLISRLKRGKVEVRVSVDDGTPGIAAEPSPRVLQRLSHLHDTVQAWLPNATPMSVTDVLRMAQSDGGPRTDWAPTLLPLASRVLQALLESRAREGERLAAVLLERVASLRQLAATALPMVPALVAQQQNRFLERWREALTLADTANSATSLPATLPEIAQSRALAEATAFAIRIDVAEELTRLASHLDEIERLCRAGGEVGKRLDFLIQELHREANTLGAKSAALELTRVSVDMKVHIEQMREQVQNLE